MILEHLKQALEQEDSFSQKLLISNFSRQRTCKLEELTPEELHRLYLHFYPPNIAPEVQNYRLLEELEKKEWKSNVIALAEKTGIKERDDWRKFNHFMLNSSRFKKHLNAHTLDELKLLYKQLKGVEVNNYMSSKKPLTKAWFRKGIQNKNLN